MYRAAIVFAPAEGPVRRLAGRLEEQLAKDSFKVTVKEASRAHMPDLAAADLILLGAAAEGREAIPADFTEIVRALAGISLAGRVVGVFALNSEPTLEAFRQALKDCELKLSDGNFINLGSAEPQPSQLQGWTDSLIGELEEAARGR